MSLNEALMAVLRDLVDERGMTYTGLARVSGVSHNSLQNYINRGRKMPFDFAEQVAEGLGMSLFDLLSLAQARRKDAADGTKGLGD